MSWVILWLLIGGTSGWLKGYLEKRYGPLIDSQTRKKNRRRDLLCGTLFGPFAAIAIPDAWTNAVRDRKALDGPDAKDSIQACLLLRQQITKLLEEADREIAERHALLGGVNLLLEEDFSQTAAQRAGLQPTSDKMLSPKKVARVCQELQGLYQRREALNEGLGLTEDRIDELRFGYEGILEASGIDNSVLALPEPAEAEPAEAEPEEAEPKGAEPPPEPEEARPPGDIVRIVAWSQADQLVGRRVRIRRASRYANQDRGIGTIQCPHSFGWVTVAFDSGYNNHYRVGLKTSGQLDGSCDLELADPAADGQPFFDRMWRDLLGQPGRATLQRLVDGAKTHFLSLSFAKNQIGTVFYLLDQLKSVKTDKFLRDRGAIAGWLSREFGDIKLSLAIADCRTPQDAANLIGFRLGQAARVLSEPEPDREGGTDAAATAIETADESPVETPARRPDWQIYGQEVMLRTTDMYPGVFVRFTFEAPSTTRPESHVVLRCHRPNGSFILETVPIGDIILP